MVMGMPTDSSCESMLARGMPAKSCPGGTGTTSGGAIIVDQGAQVGDWILAGIAILAFAALAFLIIRAVINAQRAAAYRKELANA